MQSSSEVSAARRIAFAAKHEPNCPRRNNAHAASGVAAIATLRSERFTYAEGRGISVSEREGVAIAARTRPQPRLYCHPKATKKEEEWLLRVARARFGRATSLTGPGRR